VKDLKQKTIRGGAARLVGQAARALVRLVSLIALAHLLDPSDFGLVAMVTVITGAFEIFANGGLSAATVQRAEISNEQVSTLFWCNIAIGTVLALLCLATAPVLSLFYHDQRTSLIIVALAPAFIVNATGVQHLALLQRDLRYATLATVEVGGEIVSAVVAIAMALAGFGYWSIVASVIVCPAAITIGAWLASGWIPGRPHGIGHVASMLRFGGTLTLNNLVVFGAYNFEKVLLGRYFGSDALGLYSRAYELVNLPTRVINNSIGGVAFSSLARVQNDPARLKSYFLKGYSLVVAITLPATIACAVFADDLVHVMLGPKWDQAATIFRLLAPTILVFGMINPTAWLLQAAGLQQRSLNIALVMSPLVLCSYIIGLPWGPNGVAMSFSTMMVLWLMPNLYWCTHGTGIAVRELLAAAGRALFSAIIAAVAGLIVQHFAAPIPSALLRLALGGTAMLAVYVLSLLFVMKQSEFYFDLLRSLKGSVLKEEAALGAK
jgi:O-antigen/teichoic acid export membrane protein